MSNVKCEYWILKILTELVALWVYLVNENIHIIISVWKLISPYNCLLPHIIQYRNSKNGGHFELIFMFFMTKCRFLNAVMGNFNFPSLKNQSTKSNFNKVFGRILFLFYFFSGKNLNWIPTKRLRKTVWTATLLRTHFQKVWIHKL